ncbi:MAG: MarR family transcriptional regulator [Brumimicrobium sp.]|nr:MarR family transcriptional regulator [Brumimicrobium sp.]
MEYPETKLFPLGKVFGLLTKQYIGLLSSKLESIPLNRYYYPFWIIAQQSGNISQTELATELQIDKVAVVRIVDYLEKQNFVRRIPNPKDRRSHCLTITESAQSYIPKIQQAFRETDEIFVETLEDRDYFTNELLRLLKTTRSGAGEKIAIFYQNFNVQTQ